MTRWAFRAQRDWRGDNPAYSRWRLSQHDNRHGQDRGHDRERDDDLPAAVLTPPYRHWDTHSAALTSKPIRMTAAITLLSSSLPNSGRISHLSLKAFDPLSRSWQGYGGPIERRAGHSDYFLCPVEATQSQQCCPTNNKLKPRGSLTEWGLCQLESEQVCF